MGRRPAQRGGKARETWPVVPTAPLFLPEAMGFPELQGPKQGERRAGMMVLPGVSTKPEAKGPCLPALPDGLTQFVHCVHVTHCCPRSDSGGLEAPSRRGGGTPSCPR